MKGVNDPIIIEGLQVVKGPGGGVQSRLNDDRHQGVDPADGFYHLSVEQIEKSVHPKHVDKLSDLAD